MSGQMRIQINRLDTKRYLLQERKLKACNAERESATNRRYQPTRPQWRRDFFSTDEKRRSTTVQRTGTWTPAKTANDSSNGRISQQQTRSRQEPNRKTASSNDVVESTGRRSLYCTAMCSGVVPSPNAHGHPNSPQILDCVNIFLRPS